MKTPTDPWARFSELPIEQLELSGALDWSRDSPCIKLRAAPVTAPSRPSDRSPSASVKRSSYETRKYLGWTIYPHVVCSPVPDLEVLARIDTPREPKTTPKHPRDLEGIAQLHHFFKLTSFRGRPLATPWGCEVRYGPWFATILYRQSCDDDIPDSWTLTSHTPGLQIQWSGGVGDMPQVPNLSVVWDPNGQFEPGGGCCPGYTMCPSIGGCLHDSITCQPIVPQ